MRSTTEARRLGRVMVALSSFGTASALVALLSGNVERALMLWCTLTAGFGAIVVSRGNTRTKAWKPGASRGDAGSS